MVLECPVHDIKLNDDLECPNVDCNYTLECEDYDEHVLYCKGCQEHDILIREQHRQEGRNTMLAEIELSMLYTETPLTAIGLKKLQDVELKHSIELKLG